MGARMRVRRPVGGGAAQERIQRGSPPKVDDRPKDSKGLSPGQTRYRRCPLCGKRVEIERREVGEEPPFWVHCFACAVGGLDGGAYLRALVRAEVAPSGTRLLVDPLAYLTEPYRGSSSSPRPGVLALLPEADEIRRWRNALRRASDARAYLTEERQIGRRELEMNWVGWDGDQLIFPMFRGAELVAFKTREPRPGAQMWNCRGKSRPWPLYPEPQPDDEWILLVAGELDALRGRSAGLPACSVTLGAGTWRPDWTDALRGRRVVVCFDNNEAELARRRAEQLRAAGIRARRLDLRRLGLKTAKGDLSDYLNGGGTASSLRRYLNGGRTDAPS